MLVEVAMREAAMLRPGTYTKISAPGENPSPLFCAAVLTCTPWMFAGSSAGEMLSRRPVLVGAATVNASLGHGNRQSCPAGAVSKTSQPATAASGIAAALAAAGCAPVAADAIVAVASERGDRGRHRCERETLAKSSPHESPRMLSRRPETIACRPAKLEEVGNRANPGSPVAFGPC